MNFLTTLKYYNTLDKEYKLRTKENKKPKQLNKTSYKPINENNYKLMKNDIKCYQIQINELKQHIYDNPIIVKMIDKLKFMGYSETMAKNELKELDEIITNTILKNLDYMITNLGEETVKKIKFTMVQYYLGKSLYDILGLLYSEIIEYYNYKWSCIN